VTDESGSATLAFLAFVIHAFGRKCTANEQQAGNRAGCKARGDNAKPRAKQAIAAFASDNFADNGTCDCF
jgi:hypothetical protein